MRVNRRKFVQATGCAALSTAMTSRLSGMMQTASAPAGSFDISLAFADFMKMLDQSPSDCGGTVTFTGSDPILRSRVRIGTSMALPAMAAGVGAAAIWRERKGEGQDVKVDLREAIYNTNPLMTPIMQHRIAAGRGAANDPVPRSFTFTPTINGMLYQAPLGPGNPFTFVAFQTKDGRFANVTGAYPHLSNRALNLIGAKPNRQSIESAIKQWDSKALEDAMGESRTVGAIHRTTQEWLQHPEGQVLAKVPVIDVRKIADSDPVPFTPNPQQPLSGIKGLALTHVIAGSCAARTLAEYGADILQVARDQAFEHEAIWTDVNIGMRSTFLDLRQTNQVNALNALIPQADVFMESFSGRGVERLGFGVEELAKKKPGIVYLSIRCYSWDGPWMNRAGFDMEALTVAGITMIEGGGHPDVPVWEGDSDTMTPAFPPTLVLNDYIAGYLGAAGIIAALRRRAKEGGSYHVRVSLTRAAMWYQSLGVFPNTDFDATLPDHRMIPPETVSGKTCYGDLIRLAPMVKLSKTPSRWREPLLVVRGSNRPIWES